MDHAFPATENRLRFEFPDLLKVGFIGTVAETGTPPKRSKHIKTLLLRCNNDVNVSARCRFSGEQLKFLEGFLTNSFFKYSFS